MSPSWELLLGPFGLLVGAILVLIVVFTTRLVVPGMYYAESEKRNAALEAENEALNKSVVELTREIGGYREQLAEATGELRSLRKQLDRVEGELSVLRARGGV